MTRLALDAITCLRVSLQSRMALAAAAHLFLRKQLALDRERQVTPRRADPATRVALVLLARVIDWKPVCSPRGNPKRCYAGIARAGDSSGGGSHGRVVVLGFREIVST